MKPLIIIPTYNEIKNISQLIEEILKLNKGFHILVVDDNSPDGTGNTVDQLSKKYSQINVLHRKVKEGLGKAYIAGFKWALERDYTHIFSMDADFSHDPKYLPKMLDSATDNNVVIGSRYVKGGGIEGWQWPRYVNSWGANWFTRLILGIKPKDSTAGYKCYCRKFLQSLDLDQLISSGYAFQVEMLNEAQKKGFSFVEIPIIFVDRRAGESKISGELKRSAQIVFQLAWEREGLRQFIKFGIVGFSGTIIDLGFYNLFAIGLKSNIYFSRMISFTFAAVSNYLLNRVWTFRSKEKKVAKEFGQFFFVSVIGLLLNLGIMRLLISFTKNLHSEILQKNIPVLIAITVVLFWNFFANKYWTFKNK